MKDANYLLPAGEQAGAKRIDDILNDVEVVMGKLEPEDIASLASKLTGLKVVDEVGKVWGDEVDRLQGAGKVQAGETKVLGTK